MTDVPAQLRTARTYVAKGLHTQDEFHDAVLQILEDGVHQQDPATFAAARELARDQDSDPALLGRLAHLVQETIDAPRAARLAGSTTPIEVRDVLVTRASAGSREALDLITELPATWCTAQMLRHALAVDVDLRRRVDVNARLLPAAVRLHGARAALDELVLPHLHHPACDALELAATAYRIDELTGQDLTALNGHVLAHAAEGGTRVLVRIAARMSIHHADGPAAALASHLSSRDDLGPVEPPVLGLVLWLAGDRPGGVAVAQQVPAREDEFGWGTQASRALKAFLSATGREPAEVLGLLALAESSQFPHRPIAAVGALVARLALMRMRAYLATGNLLWAGLEAAAACRYHGYRGYELHTQGSGQEFDAALCDRLALTEHELADAASLADRLGEHTDGRRLDLSEGILRLAEAPGAGGRSAR